MKPFPPTSPNGERSFPRKKLSKGVGEWNHYYIRAINGEVRLWVNGEEVSGGNDCDPRTGYLCLESEGRPGRVQGPADPRAALITRTTPSALLDNPRLPGISSRLFITNGPCA